MLHVGKRSLKTVLSLLISLFIFILLIGLNHLLGFHELPSVYVTSREFWYVPTNWYTPFFAGIATIYAMSPDIATSRRQAEIRSVGSVLGGYWGLAVSLLFVFLFPNLVKGEVSYYLVLFTMTSLGVIPLMKMIQLFHIPQAGFISGLTYLAVTISVRNGGMGPVLFTTNRVLSTVIGVGLSVWINSYPHFSRRSDDILFAVAMDGALEDQKGLVSPLCLYRLNDFNHYRTKITYMTSDSAPHLQASLKTTEINLPIVVLDGAAVYTPNKGYSRIMTMDKALEEDVRELLAAYELNPFSYVFHENHLFGYYEKISSDAERLYYDDHNQELLPMVKASVPEDLLVSKLTVVVRDQDAERIADVLRDIRGIRTYVVSLGCAEGFSCVDVVSEETSAVSALKSLDIDYKRLVVIGGKKIDTDVMKEADYSFCLNTAPEEVKEAASAVLNSDQSVDLLKKVKKIFFTGKLSV